MLHKNTFGDSPAAMYLTVLLNERDNPTLTRKVSKVLASGRETINDLVTAHFDGFMTVRTLNRMLVLISEHNHRDVTAAIARIDPFVAHVVLNVLESSVKTWKRRGSVAAIKQRGAARTVPAGTPVPQMTAYSVSGEKTAETVQARSKAYLARKNKLNTLY